MEQIISKEEIKNLLKIEGETSGLAIKDDFDYILLKKGEEGIKLLEKEMIDLGYPIKHEEIKSAQYYPSGLEAIIMIAHKKLFDFTREEFKELGKFSAKAPLVIRLFMKYFGSLEIAAKAAPTMWRRYYTKGDLKVTDFDKEKKYLVIRLENFSLHPFYCMGLEGYFTSIVEMVINKSATCQETKCVHKGDDHHEFLLRW